MAKVAKLVLEDILSLAKLLGGFILVVSFLLVCVAVGGYIACVVSISNSQMGKESFDLVMSMQGFGMAEGLRKIFSGINWLVLIATPIYVAISSIKIYSLNLGIRARISQRTPANEDQANSQAVVAEFKKAANS